MPNFVIGIDIGGTNTDIVLVNEIDEIVKSFKTATTSPLEIGVQTGLEMLFQDPELDKASILGIFVGTTHATNAIVEQKNLYQVGLIRIAGHNPKSLRPGFGWSEQLLANMFAGYETISGGFECDLKQISPFSKAEAKDAVLKLLDKGMESLAVIGVFSPISKEHELLLKEAAKEVTSEDFPISLSHEIGGIGFIERENATILNAALKKTMKQGFQSLEKIKNAFGLTCPLFITQNDGSLIGLNEAIANPLLTISSGPTNSFIGASKLAGVSDAIIVDVGGTTTDIGMIQNGFPRRSMHNASIGGISLNFRMPDVLSIGIGGGSLITSSNGKFKVGPESCGKDLMTKSLSFGGQLLTLTDVACATGLFDLPQKYAIDVAGLNPKSVMSEIYEKIQQSILLMKGKETNLPIIYVGGGAKIASQSTGEPLKNYSVANAYGAALAEFSGTVDTTLSLKDRESTLDQIKIQAMDLAIRKGAEPNKVRIVDMRVIPYHYMPNQLARVIVTASGKRSPSF